MYKIYRMELFWNLKLSPLYRDLLSCVIVWESPLSECTYCMYVHTYVSFCVLHIHMYVCMLVRRCVYYTVSCA